MVRKKQCFSIALALTMAFMPLSQAILLSGAETAVPQADSIHTFAVGPGLDNLSLGDKYATYQWGLKNDGEFQLTQVKEEFSDSGYPYINNSSNLALPRTVGPGAYEYLVTNAVTGIDINVLPAWNLYQASESKRQVVVAIIDTGVDYRHPEFENSLWTNPGEIPGDGIDNDGNGYIDDINGWDFYYDSPTLYWGEEDSHGTHSAGTIAASKGSQGITGITDNDYVKIMPLKALGGSYGTGTPDDVIKAINYAEANGVSICNLSFGTLAYSEELERTIAESNMLFVVASGNGNLLGIGYDIDSRPMYPASFSSDNIISVSNLLFDGNLSQSSNYGVSSVDIAAPGSYIVSTLPGNDYGFMSGTSMAAPMITGVAAMLYSYRPDISLSDVKSILLQTARKLDSLDGKVASGGMVDAYAALSYQ